MYRHFRIIFTSRNADDAAVVSSLRRQIWRTSPTRSMRWSKGRSMRRPEIPEVRTWMIQVGNITTCVHHILIHTAGFFSVQVLDNALEVWGLGCALNSYSIPY